MTPAESRYLSTLRGIYPMATDAHLATSPQFKAYCETVRERAWTRRKTVSDGTLARVFSPPVAPVCELLRNRLCAKCGLVFFAWRGPVCDECATPPGERPTIQASITSRAELPSLL
jgi:hypothetical protein